MTVARSRKLSNQLLALTGCQRAASTYTEEDMKTLPIMEAVRQHCLFCRTYTTENVDNCGIRHCHLWSYRMGPSPSETSPSGTAKAGRGKTRRKRRTTLRAPLTTKKRGVPLSVNDINNINEIEERVAMNTLTSPRGSNDASGMVA